MEPLASPDPSEKARGNEQSQPEFDDTKELERLSAPIRERRGWELYLRSRGCRKPSLTVFRILHMEAARDGRRFTTRPQTWVTAQAGFKHRNSTGKCELRLQRAGAILVAMRATRGLGRERVVFVPELLPGGAWRLPIDEVLVHARLGYAFSAWSLGPWLTDYGKAGQGGAFLQPR